VESVNRYKYIDDENKEHVMSSELTMGENLADIGGMSLSLKSLMMELNDQNESNVNYYCRIFFKSWGNIWKQNVSKERRIMLLSVDPHSPTDFRGNLVQHIDKFYEAFNVIPGDKMYLEPEHRMKMW
jgi:predicted metalloendopeptidase